VLGSPTYMPRIGGVELNIFRRGFRSVASSTWVSFCLVAMAYAGSAGDQAMVDRHLKAAKAAAGEDLKTALGNCGRVGKPLVIPKQAIHGVLQKFIAMGRFEPARVFDNLYFVGAKWVSAWAIRTDEGIILIDTLNNEQEARDTIEAGLRELGLDPASIKKIIVTHAHGDHYGSAQYLRDKYGAEVIMSEKDWQELAKPVLQYDDSLWGRPPTKGTGVSDGDAVTLGDTTVTVYETPGHTPGTLSLVFAVKDHGQAHTAMIWGGNGFNFGADAGRFVSYIKSAERFRDLAKDRDIDVFLSNHAALDGSGPKLKALKTRTKDQPNPYVIGVEGVQRTMSVLAECGDAVLASFDAVAVPQ